MNEALAWIVVRESVWDDEVPEVIAVGLNEQDAAEYAKAYEESHRHPTGILCWRYTPRSVPLIGTETKHH